MAVRCYRGKWGLIGFIIGLFLAIVGFIILAGLGVWLDKSQGESKCRIMRDRLGEILAKRSNYQIIEAEWNQVKGPETSDLCLGNLWLKYKIEINNKKFYFENSLLNEIENLFRFDNKLFESQAVSDAK